MRVAIEVVQSSTIRSIQFYIEFMGLVLTWNRETMLSIDHLSVNPFSGVLTVMAHLAVCLLQKRSKRQIAKHKESINGNLIEQNSVMLNY